VKDEDVENFYFLREIRSEVSGLNLSTSSRAAFVIAYRHVQTCPFGLVNCTSTSVKIQNG